MGDWKVLSPIWARNMVLSPVAQGALTTTYSVIGLNTNITASTTYAYLGCKSYRIATSPATDDSGIRIILSTLTNAVHYVTARVRGTLPTAWDWSVDNSNYYEPTLLGREGDWYVYGYSFLAAQCNGSQSLRILTKGAYTCDYYIGHVQVEASAYYTTPIVGDKKGFATNGYLWRGTPHASVSERASFERSGGKEIDLDTTYNFKVMYGVGSGMPPIQHHISGMALLPGALYGGHKVLPRVLDLVSAAKASTAATVTTARKNFIEEIKPDKVVPEQPVVFRYYGANSNKPVEIYGYYDSGLEFQINSGINDKPVARFIAYDPFWYEVHSESKELTRYSSIANADYMVRKEDGVWYNVSTDFNNTVFTLCKGADGCIYIGGQFTNVGDANGDCIVKWNPYTSALSSLDTGIASTAVFAIARAANGDLYIGGDFQDVKDANGDCITMWNGSAFTSLSTGLGAGNWVNDMAFDQSGNLFVGGSFTNITDANGDYITKWDGSAFSSLGTGMNGVVSALACAPNGDIYAAGYFTSAGGVANTEGVAYWDGSAWNALGTGLTGGNKDGYCLAFDKAGNLYIGGDFTAADGVSCNYIAKWNGQTFEPLGSGLNAECATLAISDWGGLYAGGDFTTAGGLTVTDRMAYWDGTAWNHLSINLPTGAGQYVTTILPDGDNYYIGYNTAGTATAEYRNSITVSNTGSHTVYPVIKIYRANDGTSATLQSIRNETTRQVIRCNYSIQKGETLTIDLTPGDRSVTSDAPTNPRGGPVDVWRAVLRGSDLASFGLQGGTNYISLYIAEAGSPTMLAWMEWKVTHWAADTAA